MSRGLGRVEKTILQAMQSKPEYDYWTKWFCYHVYAPDRIDHESGDLDYCDFTNSQKKSVMRALQSLEKKGFIKSSRESVLGINRPDDGPGGRSWKKTYMLTSKQV